MTDDLLHVFTRAFGVRCTACEGCCKDDAPCVITDSCPMTWCACHVPVIACPCHNGADDQCDQHGGDR